MHYRTKPYRRRWPRGSLETYRRLDIGSGDLDRGIWGKGIKIRTTAVTEHHAES